MTMVNSLIKKGIDELKEGNHEQAGSYLKQAISQNKKSTSAWYNLGVVYGKKKEYQQEIECYQKVLDIRPNHIRALINLGLAHGRIKQYDEMLLSWEKVLEIQPNNIIVLRNLSQIYSQMNDMMNTLIYKLRLFEQTPSDMRLALDIGKIYYNKQEFGQAEKYLKQALNNEDIRDEAQNYLSSLKEASAQ